MAKSTAEMLKDLDVANAKLESSAQDTIKMQRDFITQLLALLTSVLASKA